MNKRVVLIQSPFVQLNCPYPAPYYLKNFLEKRGHSVTVLDHSIGLFERIFSRPGLERVFADAERLAGTGQKSVCKKTVQIIERFLSEKNLWLNSIERIINFLRGKDHEFGHFLALANGCLGGGPRTDDYLIKRGGEPGASEAKVFATLLLSDFADFIRFSLDPGFNLVRYVPLMEASLNLGFRDFSAVEKSLNGYIMNTFYRPFLIEEWDKLKITAEDSGNPFLLGITIPFPGCLAGALVCADSAKKYFGSAIRTIAGGGFVNTELRFLNTPDFSKYFDYLSFDRGYSFLANILDEAAMQDTTPMPPVAAAPDAAAPDAAARDVAARDTTVKPQISVAVDDEAVRNNFPDYSEVDFSRYICPVDDTNPMHRLWSDGRWLKAYLAHGCYWHSCAFCDITLDYIKSFVPVDSGALFMHLKEQSEKTGVRGVHFVDEAAPVSSLLEFALLNRESGLPLNFWGNIRFDKNFTSDAAAILAAGGLIGVSAGLEVATEQGFKATGKGIDLDNAVKVLAAFKEAGILTHAYLMYGFWNQDEQSIIDSAEILRQLFSQGLLDSAFWHKFILTRHSRIYAEKQRGLHPDLVIMDDIDSAAESTGGRNAEGNSANSAGTGNGKIFALNDLSFRGEEKFDKYTQPLDALLGAWMAGETGTPVSAAFPFKVKKPSVSPGLVETILDSYARNRDANRREFAEGAEYGETGSNVLFLGSIPGLRQKRNSLSLFWHWRLEEKELKTSGAGEAEKIAALLKSAAVDKGVKVVKFNTALEEYCGKAAAVKIWKYLRSSGLVFWGI